MTFLKMEMGHRHSCMHDNISCMIAKVLFKARVRHCRSRLINLFCSLFFPKAAVSVVENCVCAVLLIVRQVLL